ncbi:MAG: hypothetical protein HKM05_03440 [Spirochaetales bacterium]|nr:hypothetical protein [Spirochaetales bacterium]
MRLRYLLLLTLASCASAPAGLGTNVPSWVLKTPQTEGDSYVFVASGTSATGDAGQAEKAAAVDLRDQIISYLGVKVTSTTSATAKGSLDSFRTSVEQTVVSQSKAEIAGLRIADRFPLKQGQSLTLYVKALYNKADLDQEKARIAALFAQIDDSVSKPEQKGDLLNSTGDIQGALDQYTQAALASLNPQVDNGAISFARNLGKATTMVSQLTLIAQENPRSTVVGEPFPQPFAVKLVRGTGADALPVAGASLRFNYKVRQNGHLVLRSVPEMTGQDGIATCQLPAPDFAGHAELIVVLDAGPFLDRLSQVPYESRTPVDALEDAVGRTRLNIAYQVVSAALKYPIAWACAQNEASSGFTQVMTKAGFQLRSVSSEGLGGASDERILRLLTSRSPRTPRVAWGEFRVDQTGKDGNMITARVSGTVKVEEVATGRLLYSVTRGRWGVGASVKEAETSAFHQLGADLGTSVIDNLP